MGQRLNMEFYVEEISTDASGLATYIQAGVGGVSGGLYKLHSWNFIPDCPTCTLRPGEYKIWIVWEKVHDGKK